MLQTYRRLSSLWLYIVWYGNCIVGVHGWNYRQSNIGRGCLSNDLWCLICCVQGKKGNSIISRGLLLIAIIVSSINQVMFRKVIGDPSVQMVAFTFTVIGLINLLLCWPITLGLYLSGTETMPMDSIPWIDLLVACILMLSTYIYYHLVHHSRYISI